MINRLSALANKFDKMGMYDLADEIDSILKMAADNAAFDQIDKVFDSLARAMADDELDPSARERAKASIVAQYVAQHAQGAGEMLSYYIEREKSQPKAELDTPDDPYGEVDRYEYKKEEAEEVIDEQDKMQRFPETARLLEELEGEE